MLEAGEAGAPRTSETRSMQTGRSEAAAAGGIDVVVVAGILSELKHRK